MTIEEAKKLRPGQKLSWMNFEFPGSKHYGPSPHRMFADFNKCIAVSNTARVTQ